MTSVSSGFRYWGDDDTLVIARGAGAYMYDMDGNPHVDYQLGFVPVTLVPVQSAAVTALPHAPAAGSTFFSTPELRHAAARSSPVTCRGCRWSNDPRKRRPCRYW